MLTGRTVLMQHFISSYGYLGHRPADAGRVGLYPNTLRVHHALGWSDGGGRGGRCAPQPGAGHRWPGSWATSSAVTWPGAVGRYGGEAVRDRWSRFLGGRAGIERAQRWFDRYGGRAVFHRAAAPGGADVHLAACGLCPDVPGPLRYLHRGWLCALGRRPGLGRLCGRGHWPRVQHLVNTPACVIAGMMVLLVIAVLILAVVRRRRRRAAARPGPGDQHEQHEQHQERITEDKLT